MSKRGVPVLIDGQPKIFRFNLNALAELEGILGESLMQIKPEQFGFKQQRAMVWAGLLHAEPKLTLGQVGELLDPVLEDATAYGDVMVKVMEAFGLAFPQAEKPVEGGDPNAQSAASGTGTQSSS